MPQRSYADRLTAFKAQFRENSDLRAGQDFFTTHSVSSLREWPRERMRALGQLTLPMSYSLVADRYDVRPWASVLAEAAMALIEAEVITLIGRQSAGGDLESLQTLLHHHSGRRVELFQCSNDTGSGYVWSSKPEEDAPVKESFRTTLVIGQTPSPEVLGIDFSGFLINVQDHVVQNMFEVNRVGVVLPVSAGGWKLSHGACHRLLDTEMELSNDPKYQELYHDPTNFARPLCLIVAEVLKFMRRELLNRRVASLS
jgi:hypothetical protein